MTATLTARFRKLDDGSWGVLVEGAADPAALIGQEVQVRRRNGALRPAKLLTLVETLADGAAVYTAELPGWGGGGGGGGGRRRSNGRPSRAAAAAVPAVPVPRTIEVSPAEMTTLLDTGTVTVDGVTLTLDPGGTLKLVFGGQP